MALVGNTWSEPDEQELAEDPRVQQRLQLYKQMRQPQPTAAPSPQPAMVPQQPGVNPLNPPLSPSGMFQRPAPPQYPTQELAQEDHPMAMGRSPASVQDQAQAAIAKGAATNPLTGGKNIGSLSSEQIMQRLMQDQLLKQTMNRKSTETTTNAYDPEALAAEEKTKQAAAEARPGYQEGLENQKGLEDKYNAMLPSMIGGNLSLKPAQQLLDQINHTHLSDSMTNQQSPFSMGEDTMKTLSSLANRKQDLLNRVGQAMGPISPTSTTHATTSEALTDTDTKKQSSEDKTVDKSGITGGTQPIRPTTGNPIANSDKWNNQVQKITGKDTERAQTTNELVKLVAPGNPIDDQRIKVIRASLDNHGRPNQQEVGMEAGSQAIAAQAQQAWDRLKTGQLSDENRADILKSIQDIAAYDQAVRSSNVKMLKNIGSKQYGQTPDQIAARLPEDVEKRYPVQGGTKGGKLQTPAISDYNQQALDWLKANPNDKRAPAWREKLKAQGVKVD